MEIKLVLCGGRTRKEIRLVGQWDLGHRSLAVLQKYLSPSVLDVSLIHI
jgi:hypothetical protein